MNEFPLFFRFIAIKIGRKVAESSDVILPRPIAYWRKGDSCFCLSHQKSQNFFPKNSWVTSVFDKGIKCHRNKIFFLRHRHTEESKLERFLAKNVFGG